MEESGTTANIVLVTGDKLYCANIGDSRSVAIIKNKPVVLSFDHKPEDREERKRIQNAGVNINKNKRDSSWREECVVHYPYLEHSVISNTRERNRFNTWYHRNQILLYKTLIKLICF